MPLPEAVRQLRAARDEHGIEGITLLGGEPFAHAASAAPLAEAAHQLDLSVLVFSGHTLEELRRSASSHVAALLAQTDILVDGPYMQDEPVSTWRWVGSANQRVHFLTARCPADDPRWHMPNTLEIRLHQGVVTINGFPARHATQLWQRNHQ